MLVVHIAVIGICLRLDITSLQLGILIGKLTSSCGLHQLSWHNFVDIQAA